MPLLITPSQLTGRSELFHQLTQVTASGLGLFAALEMLHKHPPQPSLRKPIGELLQQLRDGHNFGDSLERSGSWLSAFDVALLQAGEHSGRLPDVFRVLSAYYAQRAALARQVIMFAVYPLIVFHVAVLVFPIGILTDVVVKGALITFVLQKLAVLIPLYGFAFFLAYALQGTHAESWRATVENFTNKIPVLGQARRSLAIARLALALDALLNAGVTVIESWELAAAASGSPALRRVFARHKVELQNGRTPSEMVGSSAEFPPAFASLYHTGEITGKLDDSMKRAHAMFEEEGARKLRTFIFGFAGLLVGGVMLMAAWGIISFYLSYFGQLNDAINMNAK